MNNAETISFLTLDLPNGSTAHLALDSSGQGVVIPCTSSEYRQRALDGYVTLFLNGERIAGIQVPTLRNGDTVNLPPFTIIHS